MLPLLKSKDCPVPKAPGVYRWWFERKAAEQLLEPLQGVDTARILKENIDGKEWWCLYFGISKDLRMRVKWHVTQQHSASAVKSGFLSTLRQTITALLRKPASSSEDCVNEKLYACMWDWMPTATLDDAKAMEKDMLSKGYFPLNLQNNKGVPTEVTNELRNLRKQFKNM